MKLKKLILQLFAIVMAMAGVVSCEKEEISLAGTRWINDTFYQTCTIEGDSMEAIYRTYIYFTSESQVTMALFTAYKLPTDKLIVGDFESHVYEYASYYTYQNSIVTIGSATGAHHNNELVFNGLHSIVHNPYNLCVDTTLIFTQTTYNYVINP